MNRVPGLDLLRAIAIVAVMFTHAAVLEDVPVAGQVARFGWMGVDLFFALSGYLIGGMALRGYVWIHDLSPARGAGYGHAFIQLFMERIYYPTWTRLDGLVFGVMLAMLRTFRPCAWEGLMRRGDLVLGAAVAGLALSVWMFATQWALMPTVIGYPILSLSMAGLVAAGASRVSLIGRWHAPGAGAVAAIAYSLYLTHKQVYHMMALALGGRLEAHPLIAFLAMAGVAVLVGTGLYLAVERPFLKLRDRLIRQPGAAGTAVAIGRPAS